MYAGHVACLISHREYADWTDRQTDRRMDARPFPLDAASIIMNIKEFINRPCRQQITLRYVID